MNGILDEISIDSSANENDVVAEEGEVANAGNDIQNNVDANGNPASQILNDEQVNPLDERVARITALSAAVNNIQTNVASLLIGGEEERIFYDRKVRPLLDEVYFLSASAEGVSIAAQNLQSNAYAKKRQIKLSVDLTYELMKEAYCILDTLKKRNAVYRRVVEDDIERCGGLPSNYKSCFDALDEYYTNNEKDEDCDKD
ncbi:hypothetical protein ACH36K_13425 [Clostridium sp. MB05]|uniref:hypothetical protein n=1 Tax=Clostridium sp. MB05 TaxID=3376682 RepID=UPI0039823059